MPDKIHTSVDLSGEDIHWKPEGGLSYGRYLGLDQVLSAQSPITDEHDELMFIVIHQAGELWLKLCLHELDGAIACIRSGNTGPAFKMIARIARIQEQLTQSWSILATMTPADYLRFRDKLGQSSGFQSAQYRMLEYKMGNKNADLARVHEDTPVYDEVLAALNEPSIYDEALKLLAHAGFDIPASATDRDWSRPYEASQAVEDAWKTVYQNTDKYWALYELAEKLVDLEYRFQTWRFSHMKTVERIIGFRRGTGGSSGVGYLVKALDLRFFPELWTVRTSL